MRGIAAGFDPDTIAVAQIASPAPVTVGPNDDPADVVELMRENGIRRIPVANGADAVGIVTLGDLALDRDAHSALAEISALPSNN